MILKWCEQVRYRPNTPLVLKGISLTIEGGEKVGVVGRTGSGKSTLIQVLFRLIEPSAGKIIIDGVNICTVGLHDVRSRFGIIPQEPVLFQGTVRSNIDPLGLYSEEEVWKVYILHYLVCFFLFLIQNPLWFFFLGSKGNPLCFYIAYKHNQSYDDKALAEII